MVTKGSRQGCDVRITKKQKYLQNAINSFVYGNCEEVLKQIPNESVDLVVTSPPYADQRDYGSLESSISPDQYVKWFAPKAKEIHRVLKNNGSFVLNINDKVVGGYQHLFVFELVLHLCKKTGFNLVRDYIWYNPATPQTFSLEAATAERRNRMSTVFGLAKDQNGHLILIQSENRMVRIC